ncbi:hypothetical protein Y032_0074g835 [Ancylostoma ceylanicum]|uniref:Uncharacterized protein n=1 Tax=Ancylostoma ceylanicum TaxID=53326 RepID=A0A016TVA6_9BILA|nr:hypothetical protein Y032_0074g835 [Ancylostoma ceylanicum]
MWRFVGLMFIDGSDIPYDDEPIQMQKRFRVKYIRELGRLPAEHILHRIPMFNQWDVVGRHRCRRRTILSASTTYFVASFDGYITNLPLDIC